MSVKPPPPPLPPLNALRAFEAAARHGGFSRAAEELNVTPAAVAHHVKQLEAWAQVRLFRRTARGVILTAEGRTVAEPLARGFAALSQAARILRAQAARSLHVAALPAVAQLWLAPRLPALERALPGIDISVSALETAPDPDREGYDLALFMETSPGPGALGRDSLVAVAAPALARGIQDIDAILARPRLSDSVWSDDWSTWCKAAQRPVPPRAGTRGFSLYAMAVDAALAGGGVLIGHKILLASHLRSGALQVLPGPEVPLDQWLVPRLGTGPSEPARLLLETLRTLV